MFRKLSVMVMTVAMVLASHAAVDDSVFIIGTPSGETNTYSDNTPVNDGEKFALVWTANGYEFAGFNCDGTLVDPDNSRVMVYIPAKNGRLCLSIVQISKDMKIDNGTFGIYLLDTRVKNRYTGRYEFKENSKEIREYTVLADNYRYEKQFDRMPLEIGNRVYAANGYVDPVTEIAETEKDDKEETKVEEEEVITTTEETQVADDNGNVPVEDNAIGGGAAVYNGSSVASNDDVIEDIADTNVVEEVEVAVDETLYLPEEFKEGIATNTIPVADKSDKSILRSSIVNSIETYSDEDGFQYIVTYGTLVSMTKKLKKITGDTYVKSVIVLGRDSVVSYYVEEDFRLTEFARIDFLESEIGLVIDGIVKVLEEKLNN